VLSGADVYLAFLLCKTRLADLEEPELTIVIRTWEPAAPLCEFLQGVAHCSGDFAEAVLLRREYAILKDAARVRRRLIGEAPE
jgi:hypothetical protein